MYYHTRVLSIAILLMAALSMSSAQYAEDVLRFSQWNNPVGARTLGIGGAAVGIADDFSALFTNPAGLASIRDFEFSLGLSNLSYNNDTKFFGLTTPSDNRSTNLNSLGLVYPVATQRGSLTFAFGYGRVASFATSAAFNGFNSQSSIIESMTPGNNLNAMSKDAKEKFLDNNIPYQIFLANIDSVYGKLLPVVSGNVLQNGTVREGGGINNWSLGGAIDIAKNLSLGVGINILSGSYSYDRVFTETDSKDFYTDTRPKPLYDFDRFRLESTINSDLTGYNVLFGLMYRKQGSYKIGASIRTPSYYDISESFADRGRSWFDNGDNYDIDLPGETKYSIKTPMVMSAGASFQVRDFLVFAGDVEYIDWTEMEFTTDNLDLQDENRHILDTYQATVNLRGGVEISLFDLGVKLRAGMVYQPSPYKVDQDKTDFDQQYYTFGAGYKIDDNVTINAAFATGKWKTLRDNYYLNGLPATSSTDESVKTSTLSVTLSYRF
ncbi:MAG: outer membrane protein transport protein [bacterium]